MTKETKKAIWIHVIVFSVIAIVVLGIFFPIIVTNNMDRANSKQICIVDRSIKISGEHSCQNEKWFFYPYSSKISF